MALEGSGVGHSFGIEIDGVVIKSITEVSGMKMEQDVIEYKSNTADKWYLWIDEFTPERRYVPFETTNLAGGQWTPSEDFRLPPDPCHGVVLPVTAEEYDRLSTAWRSSDRRHPAVAAGATSR